MNDRPVRPVDLDAAQGRIHNRIYHTPVLRSAALDAAVGARLHFKAEHLQVTGSFKVRGALNALGFELEAGMPPSGVVTFSAGNHAAAVAYAAQVHGLPAIVCMPEGAVPEKVAAARGYGAEVRLIAGDLPQATRDLSENTGYLLIEPFDSPAVMAGQGTVALELLQVVPDLDAVIVPVGGGGLIGGISAALAAHAPRVRLIAAEPQAAALVRASLAAGSPARHDRRPETIADGLSAPFLGRACLSQIQGRVDDVVEVAEADIRRALAELLHLAKQSVEPSAAVGLAAVRHLQSDLEGQNVGIVLSGGNIGADMLTLAAATARD